MSQRLSTPINSNYDNDRATELLALVNQAQIIYAQFNQGRFDDWEVQEEVNVPEHGTYEILANLGRAEFMWGKRRRVPFGYVVRKQNRISVVFRGTMNIPEWISNLRGLQKPYTLVDNVGDVHRGFQTIYTRPDIGTWWELWFKQRLNLWKGNDLPSMADTVAQTLNQVENPDECTCYVTGHSLGSALATLSTLHISQKTPFAQPILYGFAGPRVGDPEFATKFLTLEAYRIANTEDIVPFLPLPTRNPIAPQKVMKEGLRAFALSVLQEQDYEHIGEPIIFTEQLGNMSDNHIVSSYADVLGDKAVNLVPNHPASIPDLQPAA